ncbi:glycerophosphodiester phosphodiesterase [Sporosarcina beigongshangi]|uniref:glycerophosphodiester phosphodiesterase n=1 Tax=Sporosarcina beigongshangi TaxID=2782538 RepID=UPI00193A12A7|nr:glycerophosphodiester phosphodiesterase family protein [Sporosarcina beigongshangi]
MRKLGKRKVSWLAGLVSACLLLLVGFNEHPPKQVEMTGMISVAHRGASSYAPENTQAAFRKGLELGADFLECDVHLSKDGELIIMHDDKVDRTTNGKGFVKDYTLDELKQLDVGTAFGATFSGEKIMTLDELLDEFYGEIGLLIEIKKSNLYPGIEEKVVALLKKHGDVSGIIVQSFDIESMRKIHSLLPELQIAVLMKPSTLLPSAKRLEDLTSFATYINFDVSYINKRMVDRIHAYGGKVLVWSKRDQQLISKAFQYGVDGIITDFSRWPVEEPTFMVRQ